MYVRVETASGKIRGVKTAALICASLLALSGCHPRLEQPPPDLKIDSEISPQPVQTGLSTVRLNIHDASGASVMGARVQLEGNMSHAGMAPVFGDTKEVSAGRYEGSLDLNMQGDWVVLVHAVLSDGQKVERQIDVQGVRAK